MMLIFDPPAVSEPVAVSSSQEEKAVYRKKSKKVFPKTSLEHEDVLDILENFALSSFDPVS